jgi:hypothetical protein
MFDTMKMTKFWAHYAALLVLCLVAGQLVIVMRAVTAVTDGLCHPVEGADSVDVVIDLRRLKEAYALADAAAGEGQWRACSALSQT